jgi:hypothetical protein
MNFITDQRYVDFRIEQQQNGGYASCIYLILRKSIVFFDNFDRPGTPYDDALRILNGFSKIQSYRLSDNMGFVVNTSIPLQIT